MKMKKQITNFVLSLIEKIYSSSGMDEEGRKLRRTRLKKFKKKSKGLFIAAQLISIWYLLIIAGSYLTSDTGAYFNDVETIEGAIATAEDFCEGLNGSSDYWHEYCKDNAGLGNNPEPSDEDTGEHTDPDNPGHNKDDCDDHTSAPCSEGKNLGEEATTEEEDPKNNEETQSEKESTDNEDSKIDEETQSKEETQSSQEENKEQDETNPLPLKEVTHLVGEDGPANSGKITLKWSNPESTEFSHVKIYVEGEEIPIAENATNEEFELKKEDREETKIYRVVTVDKSGKESVGERITVLKIE
jgi:predicted ribosomally synthesized peptide with SipW-like signal peptide